MGCCGGIWVQVFVVIVRRHDLERSIGVGVLSFWHFSVGLYYYCNTIVIPLPSKSAYRLFSSVPGSLRSSWSRQPWGVDLE